MLGTNIRNIGISSPAKTLWRRLTDGFVDRLEERRVQAELAVMSHRERLDIDVAHGNLIWSEFARTSQKEQAGSTNT